MVLTQATVRFPSGNIRQDVPCQRYKHGVDFPYRCRFCGQKVPDADQAFCTNDCRVLFERVRTANGHVEYAITEERVFSA